MKTYESRYGFKKQIRAKDAEFKLHNRVYRSDERWYRPELFQSGIWKGKYYQYGEWTGLPNHRLEFIPSAMTLSGYGTDSIGDYTVDGYYSAHYWHVTMNKKYTPNTGNPLENLGHVVKIELDWKENEQQFKGKYYVKTPKYVGEDQFSLQFVRIL